MKRVCCFCIILVLLFLICGCDNKKADVQIETPGQEVNTVYDVYGNVLQQSFYNEQTGETFTTIFKYKRENGLWVCVDQQMLVTKDQTKSAPAKTSYVINETTLPQTILDTPEVTITLEERLATESWWEFGYKLKIVNHSNEAVSVLFDNVSIASVTTQPMFNVTQVEPGYTLYFNLAWDKASLERDWVPYLNNVEFSMKVYIGTENWKQPADYGTEILIRN